MTWSLASRAEWGATAPQGPAMRLPSRGLWIHHSVTRRTRDPYADMRAIERIGKDRFGRFSYSWAYHLGARLFMEGAGNTVGAHTKGHNSTTHAVVLIGNFDVEHLPDFAVEDLAGFTGYGAGQGWWEPVLLGGHRDAPGASTACPGRFAHARVPDIRSAMQRTAGSPTRRQDEEDEMTPEQMAELKGFIQTTVNNAFEARDPLLTRAAANGGDGATADQLADELAERLRD